MHNRTLPAIAALAAFFLLPCTAVALEEPEAVYEQYHQALRAGKIEEAKKYATAAGRKQANAILPQAYDIWNKDTGADGKSITLRATGKLKIQSGEKPQTVSGVILMLKEGNSWKVEKADWQGANLPAVVKPAPQSAQSAPKKQPAEAAAPTAPAAPAPVIGIAREPCVYKPVMTGEDMARCR